MIPEKKIAVLKAGHPLEKRKCPIDGKKSKILYPLQNLCDHEGFAVQALSFPPPPTEKYNITNQLWGGNSVPAYARIRSHKLMEIYVDKLNLMQWR